MTVIKNAFPAAGGTAEIHLETGKPSEQIARAAADRAADLIVLAKHGQGWVESLATGSTAANHVGIALRDNTSCRGPFHLSQRMAARGGARCQ